MVPPRHDRPIHEAHQRSPSGRRGTTARAGGPVSDRVLVEFVCHPAKGHVYAHVDETPRGREVVIPNMAYTDAGPRVKRWPIEQRLPVESGENWGLAVICACGRRR